MRTCGGPAKVITGTGQVAERRCGRDREKQGACKNPSLCQIRASTGLAVEGLVKTYGQGCGAVFESFSRRGAGPQQRLSAVRPNWDRSETSAENARPLGLKGVSPAALRRQKKILISALPALGCPALHRGSGSR